MSGPRASVGTSSAGAWTGGTYAPTSGNPTAAGGTFTSVGAPGFPAPTAGIITNARNYTQTNARIPYARYVCAITLSLCTRVRARAHMHAWCHWSEHPTLALAQVGADALKGQLPEG